MEIDQEYAHNGMKIARARRKRKWSMEELGQQLGCSPSTIKRIEANTTHLDLYTFLLLAKKLTVDPRYLLNDGFMDDLPSISFLKFPDADHLETFLIGEEKGGRVAIFNKFPSSIYYNNNSAARERRLKNLSSYDARNTEYYPVTAIIEFGFSICSQFSKKEKLSILEKILMIFSDHGTGHLYNQLNIIDSSMLQMPQGSTECEFIPNTDVFMVSAPMYSHSILIIRSLMLVKEFGKIQARNKGLFYTSRSSRFLSILRDCISEDKSIHEFAKSLMNENRRFLDVFLKNINKDISDEIKEYLHI